MIGIREMNRYRDSRTMNTPPTTKGKLPPLTSPLDSGYDPVTLESHLRQCSHLVSMLRIHIGCWVFADDEGCRKKIETALHLGIPVSTDSGLFALPATPGTLVNYMDLSAELGATCIECTGAFPGLGVRERDIVRMAEARGLDVECALDCAGLASSARLAESLVEQGERWIDAGAIHLLAQHRGRRGGVHLFSETGSLNENLADRLATAFGHHTIVFEACTEADQSCLLDHFGPEVHLCNIRLEDILRLERDRRALSWERPRGREGPRDRMSSMVDK